MAKREETEAAQHETFPGTGPRIAEQRGDSGVHAVEQMVDAAIDRLARQYAAERAATVALAPEDESRSVARASAPAPKTQGSGAIVPAAVDAPLAAPAPRIERLQWRGLDVSEEFRRYAERVARGEDLPPYKGQVLAQPDPRFPWQPDGAPPPSSSSRRSRAVLYTLCGCSVVVAGLIVWAAALRFGSPKPPTASVPSMPADPVRADPAPEVKVARGSEAPASTPIEAAAPSVVAEPPVATLAPPAAPEQTPAVAPPSFTPPRRTVTAMPRAAAPRAPAGPIGAALGDLLQSSNAAAGPALAPPPASAASSVEPAALAATVASSTEPSLQPAQAPGSNSAPVTAGTATAPAKGSGAASATDIGGAGANAAPSGNASSRKEPPSQSSANGSLLVEKPSF